MLLRMKGRPHCVITTSTIWLKTLPTNNATVESFDIGRRCWPYGYPLSLGDGGLHRQKTTEKSGGVGHCWFYEDPQVISLFLKKVSFQKASSSLWHPQNLLIGFWLELEFICVAGAETPTTTTEYREGWGQSYVSCWSMFFLLLQSIMVWVEDCMILTWWSRLIHADTHHAYLYRLLQHRDIHW